MPPTILLLIGDQTAPFATALQNIVRASKTSSHALRRFLRSALDIIQIEARQHPDTNRVYDDGTFELLLEEPEKFEEFEDEMGILQTVFTCLARLGEVVL